MRTPRELVKRRTGALFNAGHRSRNSVSEGYYKFDIPRFMPKAALIMFLKTLFKR